ncbi:MAG: hypothetical protein J3Q66DRAFT_365251 [Benniella sp.]|nr:MAG: hypothetical protein J3Q66DRAFT_365251 [Benniella sp.]
MLVHRGTLPIRIMLTEHPFHTDCKKERCHRSIWIHQHQSTMLQTRSTYTALILAMWFHGLCSLRYTKLFVLRINGSMNQRAKHTHEGSGAQLHHGRTQQMYLTLVLINLNVTFWTMLHEVMVGLNGRTITSSSIALLDV